MTAQRAGEFLWLAGLGYVVVDAPTLKNGKPIVRVECPWCGGDLDSPVTGEGD